MWLNIMKSTKKKKNSILHYSIDIMKNDYKVYVLIREKEKEERKKK